MKSLRIDVHRNEPCPCGSGLKFKRCCWVKCVPVPESYRPDNALYTAGGRLKRKASIV